MLQLPLTGSREVPHQTVRRHGSWLNVDAVPDLPDMPAVLFSPVCISGR
jgi:hypothetical protein